MMKWKKWLLTDISTICEKDYSRRFLLFKRTINGKQQGKIIELVTQKIPPFNIVVYEEETNYITAKLEYGKEIENYENQTK